MISSLYSSEWKGGEPLEGRQSGDQNRRFRGGGGEIPRFGKAELRRLVKAKYMTNKSRRLMRTGRDINQHAPVQRNGQTPGISRVIGSLPGYA